ncbi:MAG: DNA polymerase III subunit beta [Bacteriovorax sp.]|nr:DNA polymerase III subunit beta [Bacteriovorax sp.]
MIVKIAVTDLKDTLIKILSVVDKKNTRLILNFIQIKAFGNQLEMTATDLEVSAKVTTQCIVENPGTFCVNAKNIFDIVKELPDKELTIELLEGTNSLKLTCDNINFTLLIYTSEEFPHLQFGTTGNEFKLNSNQIIEIINKTSHAISNDETRLFLNGIFLQEVDGKLRTVATDGYRLSLVETELTNNKIEALINGIIIPKKGVLELKKIAETYPDKEISISVDESFIYLNANNSYLLAIRLIAKEYLKYQAVIPKKTTYFADIERSAFINAVRRIKIMANERSNGVKLILKENEMIVAANHPSLGEAQEKINIHYSGKEFEIGFNAKFLIDTLSIFGDEEIRMELNNELSPIAIKSSKNQNYLCIVMPLKL